MPHSCARPVYHPDTRLSDLQMPELFLVTVLRLRARSDREVSARRRWREGFVAIGADDSAATAFDTVFEGLQPGRTGIGALNCHRLRPEEQRLLRLVSLLQHRRYGEVEALLASWTGLSTDTVLPAALIVANALAAVGLVVPLRRCEAASIDLLARQLKTGRGLLLVH